MGLENLTLGRARRVVAQSLQPGSGLGQALLQLCTLMARGRRKLRNLQRAFDHLHHLAECRTRGGTHPAQHIGCDLCRRYHG